MDFLVTNILWLTLGIVLLAAVGITAWYRRSNEPEDIGPEVELEPIDTDIEGSNSRADKGRFSPGRPSTDDPPPGAGGMYRITGINAKGERVIRYIGVSSNMRVRKRQHGRGGNLKDGEQFEWKEVRRGTPYRAMYAWEKAEIKQYKDRPGRQYLRNKDEGGRGAGDYDPWVQFGGYPGKEALLEAARSKQQIRKV